jgi:hypothetical protein
MLEHISVKTNGREGDLQMGIAVPILAIAFGLTVVGFVIDYLASVKNTFFMNLLIPFLFILVYILIILVHIGSFSSNTFINIIIGGIPYVSEVNDYMEIPVMESLIKMFVAFFDVIVIAAIIDIVSTLFPEGSLRIKFVTGVILSTISVVLMSYLQQQPILHFVLLSFVIFMSLASVFSWVYVNVRSLTSGEENVPLAIKYFDEMKLTEYFRKAFLKGTSYVLLISLFGKQIMNELMLESSKMLSTAGMVINMLGPVCVMFVGFYFLIKSIMA